MSTNGDQAIALLTSIDATLKALLTLMRGNAPKEVATDADLDGQWGDPVVRAKDPRDWTGESQLGKPFSGCPPEYLDLIAARLDYFAERAEAEGTLTSSGKPVAPYNRRDAARARGWAKRLRAGWTPEDNGVGDMLKADEVFARPGAPGFPSDRITDDDIPFAFFIGLALPGAITLHAALSILS